MKIVLASDNTGKLREFRDLFHNTAFSVFPQSMFSLKSPDETGRTFDENVVIKARHASEQSGLPAVADDSGLVVEFLDGAPGIYSARYAGQNATDSENIRKLLDELKDVGQSARNAYFHCSLALVVNPEDCAPVVFDGRWQGAIAKEPAGNRGFGYDPVFYVPEMHCTSAQLEPEEKNRISHRAVALNKLKRHLLSRAGPA